MKIGQKLRKLRRADSLTQEELASRADLTKGYISQLENDATSPAISTLRDILDVFSISISEFFAEPHENQVVFGKESTVVATDEDGIRVELLVPGAQNRTMDPALVTLQPGEAMEEQSLHEGEEFGFLLSGRIELTLDDKVYVVKKHECFFFPSDQRHAVRNISNGPAKILWVVTPPTFDYKGK
ncbi:MAG: Cro/Cl family transcriptional regulator [Desulfuromonadales bacterium C00003096]|nr:MAG: Cro/Cl family transcriptional regulator [Desulfuromonadales bacterium C00003096]